jgi:hypothetical protein
VTGAEQTAVALLVPCGFCWAVPGNRLRTGRLASSPLPTRLPARPDQPGSAEGDLRDAAAGQCRAHGR